MNHTVRQLACRMAYFAPIFSILPLLKERRKQGEALIWRKNCNLKKTLSAFLRKKRDSWLPLISTGSQFYIFAQYQVAKPFNWNVQRRKKAKCPRNILLHSYLAANNTNCMTIDHAAARDRVTYLPNFIYPGEKINVYSHSKVKSPQSQVSNSVPMLLIFPKVLIERHK